MHRHVKHGCGDASAKPHISEVRRYVYISGLTAIIVLVQFVGGILSGSLALFADTIHAFMDFASAAISVSVACRVKTHRDPDALRLRWMRRSAWLLLAALGLVAYEAVERLYHPLDVAGLSIMGIAAFGGLINYWQHTLVPHDHTATSRAQRLHVLGDLTTSIAVIIGGGLIWLTRIRWIDPVLSLVVVVIVAVMTIRMLRSPMHEHSCGHAH